MLFLSGLPLANLVGTLPVVPGVVLLGVPGIALLVVPGSDPRVAPGGWRYALVPLALAVPLALVALPLAALAGALAAAVLAFHRDPDRDPPTTGVLAPADGRVRVLRREGDRLRVGVVMGLSNVHVNRAPLPGRVRTVDHEPGSHWPAFSKESERNERVRIAADGFEVELIAGAVARRAHPYVDPGDTIARGERIGHITFGSRVDVLLPPDVARDDLVVGRGDRVRAGETVLAARSDRAGDR